MLNFNDEIIKKARNTQSVEELLELAKANDVEMTEDQVKEYFELLNVKSGELSDEELDNVSGGMCYSAKGLPIVSSFITCEYYQYDVGFDTGNPMFYYDKGICHNCIYRKHVFYGFYHCLNPNMRRRRK